MVARIIRFSRSRWAPLVAFLVLVFAVAYGLNEIQTQNIRNIQQSQLISCHRANLLRAENNRRIKSHRIDATVLSDFLKSARQARLAAYHESHHKTDLVAERDYLRLEIKLRSVTFHKVRLVNCHQLVFDAN